MLICYGLDCENEEHNKGCICCNECPVTDCQYRCNQEWRTCGQDLIEP